MSWPKALAGNRQSRHNIDCELPVYDSVEEAEARIALVWLHALTKVSRGPVELQMDWKTVTEYLNSDVPTLAPCYGVTQDIKAALYCFHADDHIASTGIHWNLKYIVQCSIIEFHHVVSCKLADENSLGVLKCCCRFLTKVKPS